MSCNVIPFRKRQSQRPQTVSPGTTPRELTIDELDALVAYWQSRELPTQNAHGVHIGDLFSYTAPDCSSVVFFQVVDFKGSDTAYMRMVSSNLVEGDIYNGKVRPQRDGFDDLNADVITCATFSENGEPRALFAKSGSFLYTTTDDTIHIYSSPRKD